MGNESISNEELKESANKKEEYNIPDTCAVMMWDDVATSLRDASVSSLL